MKNVKIRKAEIALAEILKSEAESRIYLLLCMKKGIKSDEIARETGLHPSTVRELLAKMYRERVIYRKKIRSEQAGKNPYIYYPTSPVKILKGFAKRIEQRLNSITKVFEDNIKVKVEVVKER